MATKIEDLLNNEDIDLIIISTPSGLHYQSCIKALKANCHVIVEKPIALLINEANKIEKLAKLKKLICCVAYQNRFNPAVEKAFEAIKKNNLGKLISVYYQSFIGDSFYNPFEYFKHGYKDYRKKNTLNKNLRSKKLIFLKYLNSYLFCASK